MKSFFGVTAETVEKDNMFGFLLRVLHCSRQPCSRTTRHTADKSAEAEKKYHDTKALYVMLSSCIGFSFFGIYLTDNIKSLLRHMSKDQNDSADIAQFLRKKKKDYWTKHCG